MLSGLYEGAGDVGESDGNVPLAGEDHVESTHREDLADSTKVSSLGKEAEASGEEQSGDVGEDDRCSVSAGSVGEERAGDDSGEEGSDQTGCLNDLVHFGATEGDSKARRVAAHERDEVALQVHKPDGIDVAR